MEGERERVREGRREGERNKNIHVSTVCDCVGLQYYIVILILSYMMCTCKF